jgi:hypothetical protein
MDVCGTCSVITSEKKIVIRLYIYERKVIDKSKKLRKALVITNNSVKWGEASGKDTHLCGKGSNENMAEDLCTFLQTRPSVMLFLQSMSCAS